MESWLPPHSSVGINRYHLARDVFQPGGLHPLQEMPAQAKDIPKRERECDALFFHSTFPFYLFLSHTRTHAQALLKCPRILEPCRS